MVIVATLLLVWTPATAAAAPLDDGATAEPLPAPQNVVVDPNNIEAILATIRYLESRGDYTLPPNRGNASGAYQFIESTWNGYAGFQHAYLAPPEIQDERATADVQRFLASWSNDVSMIPVLWYYPVASRNAALMDIVPKPAAGNVLTIREYQQRWLGVFATISEQPIEAVQPPAPLGLVDQLARLGVPPSAPLRDDELPSLVFPVLGPARIALPDCTTDRRDDVVHATGLCSTQPPSVVFGVKLQPVLAAADGVVTDIDLLPASGRPVSVTIADTTGRRYVYTGFNDDNPGTDDGLAPPHLRVTRLARIGTTVWAGQVIGFMGDTDATPIGVRTDVPTDDTVSIEPDGVPPHVRLTVIDADGEPIEAFGPVIDAVYRTSCQAAIGPWSVPARDETDQFFIGGQRVVVETTDDRDDIDSEWVITETGQVIATGWAALINPSEGCEWAPPEPYGPGAGGSTDVPGRWAFGVDLNTSVWIDLASADQDVRPVRPFNR